MEVGVVAGAGTVVGPGAPLVTVVIPTLPERAELLQRALNSVWAQTERCLVSMVCDVHRMGAAKARNLALSNVNTPYVAFLDDDDELMPHHVRVLRERIEEDDRPDLVYSGCALREASGELVPGASSGLVRFGKEFDADELRSGNYIPVTVLARTEAVLKVGGFTPYIRGGFDPAAPREDWECWLQMLEDGCKLIHVPLVTWTYYRHRH